MELTDLQKQLIIVGIEEVKKQLKPSWNDFMTLNKQGRERFSELYEESDKLLKLLEGEYNINIEQIKKEWSENK